MKFKKPSINIVQNKRRLFCQHVPTNEATQSGFFVPETPPFLSDRAPHATGVQNPVRICRPKIGELAHQAQGVRIFAEGEIPGLTAFSYSIDNAS